MNTNELPDAIRIPLHSLWADAAYLAGRAIAEHTPDLIVKTIKARCDETEAAIRAALASAPPAGEPVGEVYTMEALVPGGSVKHHVTLHKALPAGTKLYAVPQPAEPAQPATQAGAGEPVAREAKNRIAINGSIDAALERLVFCVSGGCVDQQGMRAVLVGAMQEAVDVAIRLVEATPAAQPTEQPSQDAERLDRIRKAINTYHLALDTRQHGGVAMDRAFNIITDAMDMPWKPGNAARAHGEKGSA